MISCLLPTYNRAEYLAEAIDSILNQTEKDFELIVVDDGSTDSTEKLMDYYLEKDPRIVYAKLSENKGIAYARNHALSLSTGDVIAVMDSDDLSGPDRFKRELAAIKKGADIVYSSYLRADENATVIDGVKAPKPKEITKESLLLDQGIPHVTVMAKRICFERHPYKEQYEVNDDFRLVVDWITEGYKLHYIEDPLVIVRFHTLNTSRVAWERIKEINEEVRKEIRES